MKIVYALSALFPYEKLISGDAGPSFAADYLWPTAYVPDLVNGDHDVIIVDGRLLIEEFELVEHLIMTRKNFVFLRMVDPCFEGTINHPWYRFCNRMMEEKNVAALLAYQPAETTAAFLARHAPRGFVHAPYVYNKKNEIPIVHVRRRHAVAISGAQSTQIYPLRRKMQLGFRYFPRLWRMGVTLPHPGYPDIGVAGSRNAFIGQEYISALANFRFASVCSSRCRLELLKYRELAYAGVVPVGDLPATLLDCPSAAFVGWRRNLLSIAREISEMNDTEERAARYRAFMSEKRNAERLRSEVSKQIEIIAGQSQLNVIDNRRFVPTDNF